MCGIIAVVRRRSDRHPPTAAAVLGHLDGLAARDAALDLDGLRGVADAVGAVDLSLRGAAGVRALLDDPELAVALDARLADLDRDVAATERWLDDAGHDVADIEATNAAIVAAKDALWAVRRDRLRTAAAVGALAGPGAHAAAVEAYTSVQLALSALDRLEVRGRDSAGLTVLVRGHDLDLATPATAAALADRADPLFGDRAVCAAEGQLSFVYKAAAEIGELGDNTAAIRASIATDHLLRRALEHPDAQVLVLGHTRWASVGIISQPNAHPLSSEELDRVAADGHPYVTGVLNGDVDNYADLKVSEGLRIPAEITTDAKVIPTLVARRLVVGATPDEAFRAAVSVLEGSVAIAASVAAEPGRLHLALRGSGQALYVGLADDVFLVASEPYGVVEEATRYLRLDGETPADPDNPTASRGQIVVLDSDRAGTPEGIVRRSYDGRELALTDDELLAPSITTRDIDRGDAPHYLLKEIAEAPASFRKTLRGKLVERDGRLVVALPPDALPDDLRRRLRAGEITRVLVIGQGTAAVAGQSLAEHLRELLADTEVRVEALPATELSGFRLRADMSDTLAVAISQSGTTTDTNRTVDLLRGRGASVVAIVNRRNSDLTDKADGVLYTSDGRDVEMSVASTKAFYAQVAAGLLLGYAISEQVPGGRTPDHPDEQELLSSLARVPAALEATLATRPDIAAAARTFAPSRRYWAIVGNGPNQIAARELRIKLSELCYKSIACDATEDKKHIDLSSEPMILVCAAGLVGSTADDVAKEVAIFRAHKAAPIVIASNGDRAFDAALAVLSVPDTHPRLGFVLATMVGHLFGYEAALGIDAQARRCARCAPRSTRRSPPSAVTCGS